MCCLCWALLPLLLYFKPLYHAERGPVQAVLRHDTVLVYVCSKILQGVLIRLYVRLGASFRYSSLNLQHRAETQSSSQRCMQCKETIHVSKMLVKTKYAGWAAGS